MTWQQFQGINVPPQGGLQVRERYSVTGDILSYRRCGRLYGFTAVRGYVPSQPTQEFVGTVIHQVLDRAHSHFMGRINQASRGTIPTDQEIEGFFNEVETALIAHGVRAVSPLVRANVLGIVQTFNRVEGPTLYPLVMDTEHRLQSEHPNYIMHGVVDVLTTSPGSSDPNDREIWDYKGHKRPDPTKPSGASRLADYEFQMRVYADLYRIRNGRLPRRAVIYFVGEMGGKPPPSSRPSSAVMEVDLAQSKISTALSVFDSTVQQIQTSAAQNAWNPPPNGMQSAGKETCDLCDVRWSCPVEGPRYRSTPRYP